MSIKLGLKNVNKVLINSASVVAIALGSVPVYARTSNGGGGNTGGGSNSLPFLLGINQGPVDFDGNAAPLTNLVTGEIQNGGQLPDANRDANGDIASQPGANPEFSIGLRVPLDASELTVRWNDTGVTAARVLNATGVVIDIPNRTMRFTPSNTMATGKVQIGANVLVTVGDYSHAPKGFTCYKSSDNPGTAPKFTATWLSNVAAMTHQSASQRPPMRLMKWTKVEQNGGNTTAWCGGTQAAPVTPITWASRSTTSGHAWRLGPSNDGRPLEDLIDAANAANCDLFWTAPWNADNNYYTQAFTLIKSRLSANLRLWVEVSNEVWNDTYPVATQCRNEATAAGITRQQRYAQKSLAVFALANSVFAGSMSRLIRVLNWQQGFTSDYNDIVAWPGVVGGVDALGASHYWFHNQGAAFTGDASLVFADGDANIDIICNWTANVLKPLCVAHGFRCVSYECGQSYLLSNGAYNESIQLDARMGQQYDYFHYRMSQILTSGDAICQFVQAFVPNPLGEDQFGILECEATPIANSPKAKAIASFATGVKPPQKPALSAKLAPSPANGTSMGTPSRLWPDSTFSAANNDGGRIAVNAATGEVTVANGALLAAQGTRSFTFRETNAAFPTPGYVDTVFSYTIAVPTAVLDTAFNANYTYSADKLTATRSAGPSDQIIRTTTAHSGAGSWSFTVTPSATPYIVGLITAAQAPGDFLGDQAYAVGVNSSDGKLYNDGGSLAAPVPTAGAGTSITVTLKNGKMYLSGKYVLGDPVAETGGYDVSAKGAMYGAASTNTIGNAFTFDCSNWP